MSITSELGDRDRLTPQAEAPQVPTIIEDLNIPQAVVENLLIKHLAAYPKSSVLELSHKLCIISHFVEDILALLRKKSLVEVFQAENTSVYLNAQSSTQSQQVRYGLSGAGVAAADAAFQKDAYLGPVPVSLDDYQTMVEAQDVRAQYVTRPDVERALSDVYGASRLVDALGPAINSGRALLLYGHAGTGKSFVAERLLNSLNTSVYVPYSVFAAGSIIKVFSPQYHEVVDENHMERSVNISSQYDKRWVLCKRPNVQVGGELTMDMLEVNHSEHNRVWLAPLQMAANNGILIIDDLGRQPMPVDTLLNRWIVPMEYFYDHLGLPNGQQITVPFILTLAFSTNLNPEKIADPAFLRRLGYKIQFYALEETDYRALWGFVTTKGNFEFPEESYKRLMDLHRRHNVGYFPCIPKDIAGISRDIIVFEQIDPVITPILIERAWELYFTADGQGGNAL